MAVEMPASREYMSTLTGGWRFTLPTRLREARGWREGTSLRAVASGQFLFLSDADCPVPGASAGDSSAECRLGAGGKLIVPAPLRNLLRWEPGKRLVVAEEDGALSVSPCCSLKRCRSCGSVEGVKEIIPNLYLCRECWDQYSRSVRERFAREHARRLWIARDQ